MELRHYRGTDYPYDPNRTYEQNEHAGMSKYTKPRGFWVSVLGEYDWKEWCTEEDFHANGLDVEYEVILSEGANIIHIDNLKSLVGFAVVYGTVTKRSHGGHTWTDVAIDWHRVAAEYDGIIISPYMYTWDLGDWCDWYYGWDCASGCIWNLSAIESVSVLTPVKEEA